MYRYHAVVDKIVDADTFYLTVDLGFHIKQKIKVRLLDVDAPEIRTKNLKEKEQGFKCKAFAEELMRGGKCIISTHKQGKFGRWLGDIYVDEIHINPLIQGFVNNLS